MKILKLDSSKLVINIFIFILKLLDLAEIFTGIDNLAERCETKYSLPIKDLTLSEKLDVIQV